MAPVKVRIDLSDAAHRLIHVSEILPAHAGVNTYAYPQWIPGEHLPGGPIDNLTGLVFHADTFDGPVVPWRRDLVDMFAFHVTVPSGVRTLAVSFDILAVQSRSDTTSVDHMNAHVGMLENSEVVLYPANVPAHSIPIAASVHLPEGWSSATALRTADQTGPALHGQDTSYATVSLDQFVDSPILSGDHCRQYPLAAEIQPTHTLDVCAEKAADLELQPAVLEHMNELVRQTTRLFVGHHYRHFDFLVGLSEHLDGDSLEHGQSADYIVKSLDVTNAQTAEGVGYLLPHEYIHSWCGKYRRPEGLATAEFHTPMQDDLLWVYEGLTEYYGFVVSVRAGFVSTESGLNELVREASQVDKPGRLWRPLQDTADASAVLRGSNPIGANWRLAQDYYPEGALRWLEVDMKIRELTHGRKSLDDFAAAFFGSTPEGRPGDTAPGVLTYRFDGVMKALHDVAPFDWAGFWKKALTELSAAPPMDGFKAAGYDYVHAATMTSVEKLGLDKSHSAELYYSLGTFVTGAGVLRDVWLKSPAFVAGLIPGDKVTAVNGKAYSAEVMVNAVAEGVGDEKPIVLDIERSGEKLAVRVDYHGGLKYPNYVRNANPDVLTTGIFMRR